MINLKLYRDKKARVLKEEISLFAEGVRRILERHHAGLFNVTVSENGVKIIPISKEARMGIVEQMIDRKELGNVVDLISRLELTEEANREIDNLARITRGRIHAGIMTLFRK